MAEEFQAGKMILSDIGMFNEAKILFEEVVEPAVLGAVDECVEAFAKAEQWVGVFKFAGDEKDCWLAPVQWNIGAESDELDPKAWLAVDWFNNDCDYWTALFCNQGRSGGKAGFMFGADNDTFGKKIAWNKAFKQIDPIAIAELKKIGFKIVENADGKQTFFLPFHLDAAALAKTWGNDGEFSDGDPCFDPVKAALEKLKQALPIFDTIMNAWPIKSSPKSDSSTQLADPELV